MTSYLQQVVKLHQQATAQVEALKELAHQFAHEDEHLRRRAQAGRLHSLKDRLSREIASLRREELVARQGLVQGKPLSAVLGFVAGSLAADLTGQPEHWLVAGLSGAADALAKSPPFGTVMVAVGRGGLPDDVKAVCLSQLARESNRTEAQVEALLRAEGYALLAPDAFFAVLDQLGNRVLAGAFALPVAAEQLPQLPPRTT